MNARQKAKYYKKSLENYKLLVNNPKEVHVDQTQLKHYKMSYKIDIKDILNGPDAALDLIYNNIVQQCVPIIYNNIRETSEPLNNCFIYECDIWARN